jgi:hypothetical protein
MGKPNEVPGANGVGRRTDASTCMAAAIRLRYRPMGGSSRDELRLSAATSQLLKALGSALARDPTAVPPPVRRAALFLARECHDSLPSTTAGVDHVSHPDPPCSPPRTSGKAAAPRSRAIPFDASIRLGRMG